MSNKYAIAVRYEGELLGAAIELPTTRNMPRRNLFGFDKIKQFDSASAAFDYVDAKCGCWEDLKVFDWQPSMGRDEMAALWAKPVVLPARIQKFLEVRYFWKRGITKPGVYEVYTVFSFAGGIQQKISLISNYTDRIGLVQHPGVDTYATLQKAVAKRYSDGITSWTFYRSEHATKRSIQKYFLKELRQLAIAKAKVKAGQLWGSLTIKQQIQLVREQTPIVSAELKEQIQQSIDLIMEWAKNLENENN